MSSCIACHHRMNSIVSDATEASPRQRDLDAFLGEVERRAFVMAELATRDPDEALDLVQDAMLAFVRRYADKPRAEWAPLFHRVLQNRIRDWARRRKVRSRWTAWLHRGEDENDDPIQQAPDPRQKPVDQQLDDDAAAGKLRDAVAELPLRQRQAFLLRVWEGLDVRETARVMGCSDGSVKTHLSRALGSLRQRLEEFRP